MRKDEAHKNEKQEEKREENANEDDVEYITTP